MLRSRQLRGAAVGAALILAFVFATPASARKFQMSGTWTIRNGSVFIPLQFAKSLGGSQMTMTSMGNFTNAFFFPNGPMMGMGGVTATGSAPATLMVPQHRFLGDFVAAVPLPNPSLQQITSSFGVDGPYANATLMSGGGPGSFTWCPTDPACVKGTAMDPAQGAGPRGGRIIYAAGPNQFGGSMAIGLKRGGTVTSYFEFVPIQLGHQMFGGSGPTVRDLAPGRLGFPDSPASEMVYLAVGPITVPTCTVAMGMLVNCTPWTMGGGVGGGPRLTTMGGVTTTGTGPSEFLPTIATGPMGTLAGQFTSNYGFGHTTGTVIGQQTTGTAPGDDFFTFMGTDLRTPLGAGNIQSVAGGISFRNTLLGGSTYASLHKVWMSMGAPIPTMSPAGFAAAGALMLLAVGYALRRRLP